MAAWTFITFIFEAIGYWNEKVKIFEQKHSNEDKAKLMAASLALSFPFWIYLIATNEI